jgi:hypothetical protein
MVCGDIVRGDQVLAETEEASHLGVGSDGKNGAVNRRHSPYEAADAYLTALGHDVVTEALIRAQMEQSAVYVDELELQAELAAVRRIGRSIRREERLNGLKN